MNLLGIGYIGLDVPDPAAWAEFASSIVGLMPAPNPPRGASDEARFFKADERQWRVAVHGAERPGLRYVGFDVGSPEAFERWLAHLDSTGVELAHGAAADCEARGVRDGRLVDDHTWVVNEFTGGDEWGHHGLTAEALARSVAAQ